MRHILVLEDHADTRQWLVTLLKEAFPGDEVMEAANIAQAQKLCAVHNFELALIDIGLPDGSGIELVQEVYNRTPNTYCVMATIHDDDRHLFPALQAGAQGYLLKDQPRDRLLQQLQGILRGEPPLSPSIARRVLEHFQNDRRPVPDLNLSDRERDVLTIIAKGYTRNETAQMLGISANTVAGYLKQVYRKLNVSTRAEAVLEAARHGLVDHKP